MGQSAMWSMTTVRPGSLSSSTAASGMRAMGASTVMVPVVGVIGLGDIGDGVATSVLAAGLPLVVCDVRDEATEKYRGRAVLAGSPAELGQRSDVVVVAVVNDAQVHAVLSGPAGALAAAGPPPP